LAQYCARAANNTHSSILLELGIMMGYTQQVLETIPEKEEKETLKFQNSEDCNSTDEGSPVPSTSCSSSDDEDSMPQGVKVVNPDAAQPFRMPPGLAPPQQFPQMQQVPTPQCTRNKVAMAEKLTSKLLTVSAGRPVKVWLSPDYVPLKRLDASMPAKKKPSFAEYASDKKKKTLDPSMPCKKHLPSWLMNLDSGLEAPKPKPQSFVAAPPAPVVTVEPAPR